MSTSLVMMDSSAHVRRSVNSNNTNSSTDHHLHHHIDIKTPALVSANGSLNFMKLFSNNNNHHNSNLNTANQRNQLHHNLAHLHQGHQHQPNGIAPAAPLTIKLESRVPSPCTADLANIKNDHPNSLSSGVKDLSLFISKSAASSGQQLLTLNGLTKDNNTMSATALDAINGLTGPGALSLKHRRSVAAAESEAAAASSAGNAFLPGQTHLPNGVGLGLSNSHSPSPPLLLPNGHFGRLNGYNSISISSSKRDHEDAFGPSSSTSCALNGISSLSTSTPTMKVSSSMSISSSNNNSLASLPSSTNSPSPPPLLSNGHSGHHPQHLLNNQQQHHLSHQAMVNSMMNNSSNGGAGSTNIASPTSSSFSDFGSTGKEDMSPSNSVNGYSVDSLGGDPKKKKGPAPRQQEELCLVCGDRASGYHYNALTCEGCKGFFRRSITKNAVYQCKYGNNCEIDMYMRRKCQECRLKKCLSVGMRPECVVPEYQCAIKREAKRAIKDKDKPNSTTKESMNGAQMHSPLTPQGSMLLEEKPMTPMTAVGSPALHVPAWNGGPNGGASTTPTTNLNGGPLSNVAGPVTTLSMQSGSPAATAVSVGSVASAVLIGGSAAAIEMALEASRRLSAEQEDVIKKLVYYQDEFESPSEDDIKKIAPFPLGENEDDSQKRFQHVTEMTILTVQLIVEFSKRVPFFDRLYREDQITLLKACSSEVMMLRCSRKYDIRTDSIVYANNQPYTRDNYSSASISYVADSLFNFCRRMCMLKVDNAEYALLTAIVIFSDRPALCEPRKVEDIQEHYIETLRCYVDSHRPPNKCHFAKLLGILTELRTLGNINSEMCVSLKVQNKKLPPFLAEIWDIQDA